MFYTLNCTSFISAYSPGPKPRLFLCCFSQCWWKWGACFSGLKLICPAGQKLFYGWLTLVTPAFKRLNWAVPRSRSVWATHREFWSIQGSKVTPCLKNINNKTKTTSKYDVTMLRLLRYTSLQAQRPYGELRTAIATVQICWCGGI